VGVVNHCHIRVVEGDGGSFMAIKRYIFANTKRKLSGSGRLEYVIDVH